MSSSNLSGLVISLDFELLWGVADSKDERYYDNITAVRDIIPRLIDLFERFEVGVTWATVGAVCCANLEDFVSSCPKWPHDGTSEAALNPLGNYETLLNTPENLLFAPELVEMIALAPLQELGCHSFGHIYACAEDVSASQFGSDVAAAVLRLKRPKQQISSFVFPRNQVNPEYLSILEQHGFSAFRGNTDHWAYAFSSNRLQSYGSRIFRFVDSYLPLSGSRSVSPEIVTDSLVDVPASCFFRPYKKQLSILEPLKIRRIKWSMKRAARSGRLFHLWWHPHNFGAHAQENLCQLEEILTYFSLLRQEYNFESLTMEKVSGRVLGK